MKLDGIKSVTIGGETFDVTGTKKLGTTRITLTKPKQPKDYKMGDETNEQANNAIESNTLLGVPVDFYDDKKKKMSSHEAKLEKRADASMLSGYGSIEATGFGSTKEESLDDLKSIIEALIKPNRAIGGN